jgi:glycosyltransferase involved in cell wall biosynthesis
MKISVFSNVWPPVFVGGYEIGASQLVEELRRRGHEVLVLSAHEYHLVPAGGGYDQVGHAPQDRAMIVDVGPCVLGSLPRFVRWRGLSALAYLAGVPGARRRYQQALRAFRPDCLLAFNPAGVLAPVLDDFAAYGRAARAPVGCYVSDHWLATWPVEHPVGAGLVKLRSAPDWTRRAAGVLLRRAGLAPQQRPQVDCFFYCSDFIRRISQHNAALPPAAFRLASKKGGATGGAIGRVAPWGISGVRRHAAPPDHFQGRRPLTLLYTGQILEHKGLRVLIRALALCRARHPLVVIGDDRTDYAAACKRLAEGLGVLGQVQFLGKKDPEDMLPLLIRSGHVHVMPSVWDEPFSIAVLEAMGIGLPVVAADTGGTAEAIVDGDNGFLFGRGDYDGLAAVIDRLEGDRALCRRIGSRARECVLRRYTVELLADRLEGAMREFLVPARKAAA